MYFAITNPGVASFDNLLTFGVSSSRGKEDKIGQFGSGFKFGILCLLREGIDFAITVGTKLLKFTTEFRHGDGATYTAVKYSINNGVYQSWPVALEFGALNWNSVDMALREFVSNAIDNTTSGTFAITNERSIQADPNTTRVFVQQTPATKAYFNNIKTKFLHFSKQDTTSLIPNENNQDVRFYRKGVYVRSDNEKSLWHYNGDLQIDECRNSDPYNCRRLAAGLLQDKIAACDTTVLEPLFHAFDKGLERFETGLYDISSYHTISLSSRKQVAEWFKRAYPNRLITFKSHRADTLAVMQEKGFSPLKVSEKWFSWLKKFLPTVDDIPEMGLDDCILLDPSSEVLAVFNKVNLAFKDMGWAKKDDPIYKMFACANGQELKLGFRKGDIVAMNKDNISYATAVEELLHYHHDVLDFSRSFQHTSMNMIGDFIRQLY